MTSENLGLKWKVGEGNRNVSSNFFQCLLKFFRPNLRVDKFTDGTAQKWSDIDVGIRGEKQVPGSLMETVREELEESDIPYKVEVVDFTKVSDKFKRFALEEVVEL